MYAPVAARTPRGKSHASAAPRRTRRGRRANASSQRKTPGGRGAKRPTRRWRRKIAATEIARRRDGLQHETQVLDREVREVGEHLRDVSRRHAEPLPEGSADLVDGRRRNPRTVAAGIVDPLRNQRRERAVHVTALDRAAEHDMV